MTEQRAREILKRHITEDGGLYSYDRAINWIGKQGVMYLNGLYTARRTRSD